MEQVMSSPIIFRPSTLSIRWGVIACTASYGNLPYVLRVNNHLQKFLDPDGDPDYHHHLIICYQAHFQHFEKISYISVNRFLRKVLTNRQKTNTGKNITFLVEVIQEFFKITNYLLPKCNGVDEGLTFESFKLLSEEDLKELGFKMGARKLVLQWIQAQNGAGTSSSQSVLTATLSSSSVIQTTSVPSASMSQSSVSLSQSCPLVGIMKCQLFWEHDSYSHSALWVASWITTSLLGTLVCLTR